MVKHRKRSKSLGNRRQRKRTIKINRKFNKKRSRRRRRKRQKGGAPAWLSGITSFFGKKKEPDFTNMANIQQQQTPQTSAGKQSDNFIKQMGQQFDKVKTGVGALADKTTNAVTNVTNIVNKPELKGMVDRTAMNDFQKLEADFKKLQDQFGKIGDWINKRTKDPKKCPCCKRPLDDLAAGKGVAPQQPGSQTNMQPPSTQTPIVDKPIPPPALNNTMEKMNQMQQMQMQ